MASAGPGIILREPRSPFGISCKRSFARPRKRWEKAVKQVRPNTVFHLTDLKGKATAATCETCVAACRCPLLEPHHGMALADVRHERETSGGHGHSPVIQADWMGGVWKYSQQQAAKAVAGPWPTCLVRCCRAVLHNTFGIRGDSPGGPGDLPAIHPSAPFPAPPALRTVPASHTCRIALPCQKRACKISTLTPEVLM